MSRKENFDISKVEGVTPEIIREYKRLNRRERYLREIDRQHIACRYGKDEEIYSMFKVAPADDFNEKLEEQIQLLYTALDILKSQNELNYCIIIDYYFSPNKYSYRILAEKYGICKQTTYNRIQRSILILRKTMIELTKNHITNE